jgi:hypothetical protein
MLRMMNSRSSNNHFSWKCRRPLCHPDRSVAQWRDLQFCGPFLEVFSTVKPPSKGLRAVKDLNFRCRDMNTMFLIAGQRATQPA